jgi:hypothetical protein
MTNKEILFEKIRKTIRIDIFRPEFEKLMNEFADIVKQAERKKVFEILDDWWNNPDDLDTLKQRINEEELKNDK